MRADVVARAAAVTLAVLVPPVVLVRALLGTESDSPLWYLIVLVFFVAFYAGGNVAGRLAPPTAIKHAAASGGAAFGTAVLVAVVRNVVTGRPMGMAAFVTVLVFSQVAVSVSALGGLVARRRGQAAA